MIKNLTLASFVMLFAVVLAACTPAVEESSTMPTEDESMMVEESSEYVDEDTMDNNIVRVAQATPDLSTLVTAVAAADLTSTLSGPGPFTVFAPDNAAFAKVPKATLDQLLTPAGEDQLTSILTYHVVSGSYMAADLTDGQTLTTVQGEELTVDISAGKVMVGGATVTAPDVEATNGVVHVIDTVLMPSAQ